MKENEKKRKKMKKILLILVTILIAFGMSGHVRHLKNKPI